MQQSSPTSKPRLTMQEFTLSIPSNSPSNYLKIHNKPVTKKINPNYLHQYQQTQSQRKLKQIQQRQAANRIDLRTEVKSQMLMKQSTEALNRNRQNSDQFINNLLNLPQLRINSKPRQKIVQSSEEKAYKSARKMIAAKYSKNTKQLKEQLIPTQQPGLKIFSVTNLKWYNGAAQVQKQKIEAIKRKSNKKFLIYQSHRNSQSNPASKPNHHYIHHKKLHLKQLQSPQELLAIKMQGAIQAITPIVSPSYRPNIRFNKLDRKTELKKLKSREQQILSGWKQEQLFEFNPQNPAQFYLTYQKNNRYKPRNSQEIE